MKNNKCLNLYKIGKFYNAYGDDGIILHNIMGYKYVEYKSSCGFPESALVKVRTKLEDNKLSYNIYDKDELKETYKGISNNYSKMLEDALQKLDVEKRVIRAQNIIDKCTTEDLNAILEVIEHEKWK